MKILRNEQGAALLLAMLAMVVILTLGMTLLDTSSTEATIAANQVRRTQAMYAAEAGLEETLAYLKKNKIENSGFPYTRNNVAIGYVDPGNLEAKYSIVISKSADVITVQSTGQVGNSTYVLNASGKYKSGGNYLTQSASVYGTGSGIESSFSNNVTVTGPITINHNYVTGSNVNIGDIPETSSETTFPEPEENWYLPPGIQAAPEIIKQNVTNSNKFETGSNWYYVQGDIELKNNEALLFPNKVVIEATGSITISNNVSLENVILVTKNETLTISNNADVKNAVLYGYKVILENNFGDVFNNVENILVYSETDITVSNNANITNSIMMCKGQLSLENNVAYSGSVICESISMNNNAQLAYEPNVAPPIIPPSIEEIAVSLLSWGRTITE